MASPGPELLSYDPYLVQDFQVGDTIYDLDQALKVKASTTYVRTGSTSAVTCR